MNRKTKSLIIWTSIVVLTSSVFSGCVTTTNENSKLAARELFVKLPKDEIARLETRTKVSKEFSKLVVRKRYAKLDRKPLFAKVIDPAIEQRETRPITFNLFDDVQVVIDTDRVEKVSSTRINWTGSVRDVTNSRAVFVIRDDTLMGNIRIDNRLYQIRPLGGNSKYVIFQVDQKAFPPELPPREPGKQRKAPPIETPAVDPKDSDEHGITDIVHMEIHLGRLPLTPVLRPELIPELIPLPFPHQCGPFIDVLVLYTTATKEASVDIDLEIELAITETNDSYTNSGIRQRLRLVHAQEVSYVEAGDMDNDLDRLEHASDGRLDIAYDLRGAYSADMVSLWVEGGDYCGIANIMTDVEHSFASKAFSVVARSCATGNYSFGHELGHNMGARHDRYVDNTNGSPYNYNHGYLNVADNWRTIMAYNNECDDAGVYCTRLQFWSNPDIDRARDPMGTANDDNRRTLNNTASTVASFKTPIYDTGGQGWGSSNYTTDIAFGDTNADDREEIGIVRKASGNARYWILGLEQLRAGGESWGSGNYATSIAFGDVDNDGLMEVGIARKAGSNARYWVLDDADHGFTTLHSGGESWGSGNYATSIAFGDVDGDGFDEVGIARKAGGNARYWVLDDADHGFTTLNSGGQSWGSGNYATSIAFGDVDGDNMDEVGITRKAGGNARYWVLDDAEHGFSSLKSGGDGWGSSNYATSIAFGDVDNDGLDEVGIARKADGNARYWVLDDANHNFSALMSGGSGWGSGNYATGIAFGDVDNDGWDEVGIARKAGSNPRYWVLDDAGCGFPAVLAGGATWGSSNYATSIEFGDVDNDSIDEVGVARKASGNQRFLILDINQ